MIKRSQQLEHVLPTFTSVFFQDSYVGVWKLPEGTRTHTLTGHNGGVTGISLQGSLAATSSYDSMVRKMAQKSEF